MFAKGDADAFRQGELLQNVVEYIYDVGTGDVSAVEYPFGIILAQDCDLQRYYEDDPVHDASVLIFPADEASQARVDAGLNSKLWSFTKKNDNPRYHVIQECPDADDNGDGITHLLIDFRRFFSIQHVQLRRLVANGEVTRRTRLIEPYRDHLQSRAMAYLSRVPLDPPHQVP